MSVLPASTSQGLSSLKVSVNGRMEPCADLGESGRGGICLREGREQELECERGREEKTHERERESEGKTTARKRTCERDYVKEMKERELKAWDGENEKRDDTLRKETNQRPTF